MKESIFFNKEQLKMVNRYNVVYLLIFKYGVGILAGILSFFCLGGMYSSGYFSSIYLLENQEDMGDSQAKIHYENKEHLVKGFSGLEGKVLNGKISDQNGKILAQDVFLVYSGLTLPRFTNISYEDLKLYAKGQDQEDFSNDYMSRFFHVVLADPIIINDYGMSNPPLFSIDSSITDKFALNCLVTKSRDSFICKKYINVFLDRFYLYDLNNAADELNQYFLSLKSNSEYKKRMCEGLLRYGRYGGVFDNRFLEIFRDCGKENFDNFVLMRDFLALSDSFLVGYVDSQVYTDRYLNEYKLFSLQQSIYKQLSVSADSKSIIQSYLEFIHNLLVTEENVQSELLSPFAKSFTYWYNMSILSPFLKDENSKINKEDKVALNNELRLLNYGDGSASFHGLQAQSRYVLKSDITGETIVFTGLSLKDSFMQSYIPTNFNVFSIDTGNDENSLIVRGKDLRTEFILEASLYYDNLELSVTKVNIQKSQDEDNKVLTDYINGLIENTDSNYTLNQILSLMYEYKDFTDKSGDSFDICDQLGDKYNDQLLVCEPTIIRVLLNNRKGDEDVVYAFHLQNGILKDVEISDDELETQLLNELDLSNLDSTSTYYIITNILSYSVDSSDSGFGMRDYLSVSQVVNKYLGKDVKIVVENGGVKVIFSAGGINFFGIYDMISHELDPISIDLGGGRRSVIVQGLKLKLSDDNLGVLNQFQSDTIGYLKEINSALVNRYFPNR